MKLNQECIRDLLLYLENNLTIGNNIVASNLTLKQYSSDDIVYTTDKLYEAGFINCSRKSFDNKPYIMINSISYSGHQYLDTIRDNRVWKETKQKLSKFSSVSLPIIQELASSLIKSKLGLT